MFGEDNELFIPSYLRCLNTMVSKPNLDLVHCLERYYLTTLRINFLLQYLNLSSVLSYYHSRFVLTKGVSVEWRNTKGNYTHLGGYLDLVTRCQLGYFIRTIKNTTGDTYKINPLRCPELSFHSNKNVANTKFKKEEDRVGSSAMTEPLPV